MFEPPAKPLPLPPRFSTPDAYIASLLAFSRTPMLQTLCGGVHILDFFTRDPPNDIYSTILPADWRAYFSSLSIEEVLDVLMRLDLNRLETAPSSGSESSSTSSDDGDDGGAGVGARPIPATLKTFIQEVRDHCLVRDFVPRWANTPDAVTGAMKLRKQYKRGEDLDDDEHVMRHMTVGMKPKKMHEVENFARLLHHFLASGAISPQSSPGADASAPARKSITHIVDIGSGQGYLPRILASPAYGYDVIAIESKRSNIEGARSMDAWVDNREENRLRRQALREGKGREGGEAYVREWRKKGGSVQYVEKFVDSGELSDVVAQMKANRERCTEKGSVESSSPPEARLNGKPDARGEASGDEEICCNGCQKPPVDGADGAPPTARAPTSSPDADGPRILLTSLHSCGDLVHHALNSLIQTPAVHAVALIGCCYNLISEKLNPPTFKPPYQALINLESLMLPTSPPSTVIPPLRNPHPRLLTTAPSIESPNPHGFPLSNLFTAHRVSLNITARMMACQAPQNWTKETSHYFFTRHFYRALLQRVLVDAGLVGRTGLFPGPGEVKNGGVSGEPVIIGSLRPQAYTSFPAYVKAALGKLNLKLPPGFVGTAPVGAGASEEEVLQAYHKHYSTPEGTGMGGFHALATTWALMAFCAGVVESLIVADRWTWLREHMVPREEREEMGLDDGLEIDRCWVEVAFGYEHSPRNLVVVGVKRGAV
ncbi:methyltransferase domain-containing protein [Kalaharituber pfeilii]|nr:methyltransferase domain-containing protein [Kalaharituber pfeilii]